MKKSENKVLLLKVLSNNAKNLVIYGEDVSITALAVGS